MGISEQKIQARSSAFARRAQAHKDVFPDLVEAVLELANDADIIAAYMPIRTEINPIPAMRVLASAGKRICVPVIIGEGQPLEFQEWTPSSEMVDGPFGAQVPARGARLVPDLVLAPLVAFDDHGTRLGYGGGFYDRSLEKLRAAKQVGYFGMAYSAQRAPEPLPREATDIRLDGIVTELGITRWDGK